MFLQKIYKSSLVTMDGNRYSVALLDGARGVPPLFLGLPPTRPYPGAFWLRRYDLNS
jgi:hypothetical protein